MRAFKKTYSFNTDNNCSTTPMPVCMGNISLKTLLTLERKWTSICNKGRRDDPLRSDTCTSISGTEHDNGLVFWWSSGG